MIRNIGLLVAAASIGVATAQSAPADNVVDLPGDVTLVITPSEKVACQIEWDSVDCGVSFQSAVPVVDGYPASGMVVYHDGRFRWLRGDIGGGRTFMPVSYGVTYRAAGWTFTTTDDGTMFTNDATGHGMFVNTKGVKNF